MIHHSVGQPDHDIGVCLPDHLVVIQNGLNGLARAMRPVKEYLEGVSGSNYHFVISPVNDFYHTWFGINACGQRLADFVQQISETKSYRYISFIGHSLGGLMIRNAIGHLYERGYFENHQPVLYASVATPHLGSTDIGRLKQSLARHLLRSTGRELLLEDPDRTLLKMSTPDSSYMLGRYSVIIENTYVKFTFGENRYV